MCVCECVRVALMLPILQQQYSDLLLSKDICTLSVPVMYENVPTSVSVHFHIK